MLAGSGRNVACRGGRGSAEGGADGRTKAVEMITLRMRGSREEKNGELDAELDTRFPTLTRRARRR